MSITKRSHLHGGNASYLEGLLQDYLKQPELLPEYWRNFFARLLKEDSTASSTLISASPSSLGIQSLTEPATELIGLPDINNKQVAVMQLISAYRYLGHRQADIDPLKVENRPKIPELSPEYHGLTSADMDSIFSLGSSSVLKRAPLHEILNMLAVTYCGTIGSEFKHITDTEQKEWIQKKLESFYRAPDVIADEKKRILEILIAAEALEVYLHKKYVGQKRFSLEGSISLIPLVNELINRSAFHEANEVIIGMAHRGRLNVLVNILGKSPEELFKEFEDVIDPQGSGDVKYHKGFSSDLLTNYGPIHTVLAFNPSHLEAINPVVEGSVRARQERRGDIDRSQVIPLLIHGDAAFAGQGVVMETLNLSKTRGYTTGGTVHVIVNNQIGFTTSDALDSRSTLYCTDVAKMVQAPIFHVNGDDPEAVILVARLALDFRMKFHRDVVIDMVCYRRHGHNEADEPSVTQPIMYQFIRPKKNVRRLYAEKLIDEKILTQEQDDGLEQKYLSKLERGERVCGLLAKRVDHRFVVDFKPYLGNSWRTSANTSITLERIKKLTDSVTRVPDGFNLHPIVKKLVESRKQMGRGELNTDWGFAETLAYASLLEDGFPIRLSGQDSVRGTFFHRHCAFYDQKNGATFIPLRNLFKGQPQFLPINSLLSEEAVLGYEVGYSTADPKTLVIWEAQFGDFANNAQVYIDQFISSSEAKWQRYSGLIMFLPHGYEGQGPEHSSARLERYLQLCAEENMQVCVPSTPAQMFHLLRRQMLRPYRKALIVMTPKSLLRNALSSSPLDEYTSGGFQIVIKESDALDAGQVTKIILCTGKVYYDLLQERRNRNIASIAIIRVEQLYPFPLEEMKEQINSFPNAKEIVWVQEEARNQGAWFYMQSRRHLPMCLSPDHNLTYAGRPYSASPAVGSLHIHKQQQRQLIDDALKVAKSVKTLRSVS